MLIEWLGEMSGGKSIERLGGRWGKMNMNHSQLSSPDEGLVDILTTSDSFAHRITAFLVLAIRLKYKSKIYLLPPRFLLFFLRGSSICKDIVCQFLVQNFV